MCSVVGANYFLETRDMKYWMNAGRRRKFQFISNRPNLLKNPKCPIELWSELMTPFEFQGGLLVRLQMKKNHITDLKGVLRTVLIGLLLHAISFHVNILLQNVENLIPVSKNHVNFLNW